MLNNIITLLLFVCVSACLPARNDVMDAQAPDEPFSK